MFKVYSLLFLVTGIWYFGHHRCVTHLYCISLLNIFVPLVGVTPTIALMPHFKNLSIVQD